jgi:hypothetical protein
MPERTRTARGGRRGTLAIASLGAVGAVLLGLSALSGATVAADGTLIEPFAAIALATLALTIAGVVGLTLAFREVRRRSTCGRDGC